MVNNDYLIHHGVKGMKWGVRHDPERSGERKARRKTRRSIARNYTGGRSSDALKIARRQDINKMSNQELQQHITRLNLERQYRSLTKVDLQRGQNFMKNGIKTDQQVKTIVQRAGNTGKKVATGMAYVSGAPMPLHL